MLIGARTSIARFTIDSFLIFFVVPYFNVCSADGAGVSLCFALYVEVAICY